MKHSRNWQPGTTLQLLVICFSRGYFMGLRLLSFSRNPLDLQLNLSPYQLNTKSNTIKSHKIQGTRLKQIQHFLSWNKANIKHSCKSQLYTFQVKPPQFIAAQTDTDTDKTLVKAQVNGPSHGLATTAPTLKAQLKGTWTRKNTAHCSTNSMEIDKLHLGSKRKNTSELVPNFI